MATFESQPAPPGFLTERTFSGTDRAQRLRARESAIQSQNLAITSGYGFGNNENSAPSSFFQSNTNASAASSFFAPKTPTKDKGKGAATSAFPLATTNRSVSTVPPTPEAPSSANKYRAISSPYNIVKSKGPNWDDLFVAVPESAGMLKCQVFRDKSTMFPTYSMYCEKPKKLLMVSRKRMKTRTPSYIISTDKDNLTRNSEAYVGKLRSNFAGTEWSMFTSDPKEIRHQVGGLVYEANAISKKGPRRMSVLMPPLNSQDRPSPWLAAKDSENLISQFRNHDTEGVTVLENRMPVYNEQMQTYVLNFNRRVSQASVKNFQIVDADDPDIILLQFGKCGDNFFTLDFKFPFSPYMAFCMAISACERKMTVD